MEFAINPASFHDVFAPDLPDEQTAIMAATQRPVAELAFSEPSGLPAWKTLPSWAVVATGDKAAGADVIRSMAQRAGAEITEAEGSHVIMMSQPQPVTDVILTALETRQLTHIADNRRPTTTAPESNDVVTPTPSQPTDALAGKLKRTESSTSNPRSPAGRSCRCSPRSPAGWSRAGTSIRARRSATSSPERSR